jgi:hypothetical protein
VKREAEEELGGTVGFKKRDRGAHYSNSNTVLDMVLDIKENTFDLIVARSEIEVRTIVTATRYLISTGRL